MIGNNNRKSNERQCIIGNTKDALKGTKFKPFRYTVDFSKPLSNKHLKNILEQYAKESIQDKTLESSTEGSKEC